MSVPLDIPVKPPSPFANSPSRRSQNSTSPSLLFHIPSPIITRRTRTCSTSEKASKNPTEKGTVRYFCRHKGHGFVQPEDGSPEIFVHVSDIEGEYVPLKGDEVTYKLCPIPPKNERFQAVHVQIIHLSDGTHERWDNPSPPPHHRS